MPRLTECLIPIELALAIKGLVNAMQRHAPNGNLQFRCPECKYAVKPHDEGEGPDGIDAAHFEHLRGHPENCSMSRKGNLGHRAA
jgi:hypothetical protein